MNKFFEQQAGKVADQVVKAYKEHIGQ